MTRAVCVCTSYAAAAEPRAVRHAVALASGDPRRDVIFLDCIPRGQQRQVPVEFERVANVTYLTHYYPYRGAGRRSLVVSKLRQSLRRVLFKWFGMATPDVLSTRSVGLARRLSEIDARVYVAHNIDALLPAHRAARMRSAMLVFDSMEYYSEMGNGQGALERAFIKQVERACLPDCALVLASSDHLADALAADYGIKRPLALYNAPPREPVLPERDPERFTLYWRNSTLDLGQRGLGDALAALARLPADVSLHLRGRLSGDRGIALKRQIEALRVTDRVDIYPPHLPHEAVTAAAPYSIGLCLERDGIKNHQLAASNKLFDYLMAGLAVVASDLPGLRSVITRSGGMLYRSGSVEDLVAKIEYLYYNRACLKGLQAQARAFALREGNREHEMEKFLSAYAHGVEGKGWPEHGGEVEAG
jgi:glycosyltransferase involved in cell wall biosynthesis